MRCHALFAALRVNEEQPLASWSWESIAELLVVSARRLRLSSSPRCRDASKGAPLARMYESQKERTMAQQFNVEQIMFAQDGLKETASTVAAMKGANKELKKQFKSININQVDDLQDDMADLLEQAEEVQAALGRSYNTDDIDEADLEAELAAMEDDPSLFFSSEVDTGGAADYLDLPATSTLPVEAAGESSLVEGAPVAAQQPA